jgi:hypothetical protein
MSKSKAGGGVNSRQHNTVSVKAGKPQTNVMSPRAVNQLGNHLGNPRAVEPLKTGTAKQVPPGNLVALNSGSKPGQGRTIHATGSQAHHGSNPGNPRPSDGPIFPGFGKGD